jgi:hydrogenase nickel incorporation protein HypA/HybF
MVDIILGELKKQDGKRLTKVRVNIGKMSGVVPEALSFCFALITEGTELEGSELVMDIIPLSGLCLTCQSKFDMDRIVAICPRCGSRKVSIIGGRELTVVELEVE